MLEHPCFWSDCSLTRCGVSGTYFGGTSWAFVGGCWGQVSDIGDTVGEAPFQTVQRGSYPGP